ncbi:hypothetical protein [Sphingomonas jeddahensis]|uniref:Uncharacterized protein n=1 Tax=Sphingomonas jeddahensis TaxID=1915074 RepID=A0A1V2ETC2_9SPHN|nr:hypothetical protein [Sphingomonas jeddahensis]ONF95926.1 hypothetical protein SPHI_18530 [Sphingomonas jeddahensis]
MRRLGCLLFFLLPGTAQAQTLVYHPITAPGVMFPVVMNPCPGGTCPLAKAARADRAGRSARASAARRGADALAFTSSVAARQANVARFVRASNNDAALRQIAAQADRIFSALSRQMASKGLSASNVGDAYTVW